MGELLEPTARHIDDQGRVLWKRTLPLRGELKLSGSVSYQACDNDVCYMPTTQKFEIVTKIVAAGEKTELNQPELFKGFDPKAFTKTGAATQPAKGNTPSSSSGVPCPPTRADRGP